MVVAALFELTATRKTNQTLESKMETHKPCSHVRPSLEDLARITRIEEEIIGRVQEMARILARIHGKNVPTLPVIAFTRREERGHATSAPEVAWHEFTTVDGETGCWDNVHEVCCSGRCPC
jgi:hypothetical protein